MAPTPVQTETTQTTQTAAPVETSQVQTQTTQVESTPQQSQREQLYQRYQSFYPEQTQPQTEQTTQQAQPVQQTTPVVQQQPDEVQQTLQAMRDEIAQLKSQIPQPAQQPQQQTQTIQESWVDKLRKGDFEGAENLMTERIKAATAADVIRQAANEAVESIRVRNEIEAYVKDLRANNPEMVPMERYMLAPVQQRLAQVKDKITSGDDLIREYKAAVDAELNELRKVSQQYRAAGKTEAFTTKREVLSASTLNPQQITQERTSEADQSPDVSPESYFAQRAARNMGYRGLSV